MFLFETDIQRHSDLSLAWLTVVMEMKQPSARTACGCARYGESFPQARGKLRLPDRDIERVDSRLKAQSDGTPPGTQEKHDPVVRALAGHGQRCHLQRTQVLTQQHRRTGT